MQPSIGADLGLVSGSQVDGSAATPVAPQSCIVLQAVAGAVHVHGESALIVLRVATGPGVAQLHAGGQQLPGALALGPPPARLSVTRLSPWGCCSRWPAVLSVQGMPAQPCRQVQEEQTGGHQPACTQVCIAQPERSMTDAKAASAPAYGRIPQRLRRAGQDVGRLRPGKGDAVCEGLLVDALAPVRSYLHRSGRLSRLPAF